MNLQVDVERLLLAQKAVRAELLAERASGGYWVGHVASSPFATAAAVSALVAAHHADTEDVLRDDATAKAEQVADQVVQGDLCEFLLESVNWLAQNQNDDGGWGDCVGGQSNLAATLMVQAAFRLTGIPAKYDDLMLRADQFIAAQGGVAALRREHREDRTLLAAVLASCALAGIVSWRQVPALPFELACLPSRWQQRIQLPIDRTSLPLLLAVGRAKFHHDPPHNPLTRLWRRGMRAKSLVRLGQLQAADDSFLASVPTTAFIVLSLASIGCQDHTIVQRGVEFLLSSVRGDASWPVQTNLATTVTTLALESLVTHERENVAWQDTAVVEETATSDQRNIATADVHPHENFQRADNDSLSDDRVLDWLLGGQRTERDAITGMSPGGWTCSDSPGALPNAINTAGALIALAEWPHRNVHSQRERVNRTARLGVTWLLDLQNDDGGWPTFYRHAGGFNPDKSGADVTARVLRALAVWQKQWRLERTANVPAATTLIMDRIAAAIENGWQYLESVQREDGSFIPLWFGNEYQPDDLNPVVGTAEILIACVALGRANWELATRAALWLASAQHAGGGWGPPRARIDYSGSKTDGFRAWRANEAMAKSSSVEETALSVTALLPLAEFSPPVAKAVSAGLTWLVDAVEQDAHRRPAVIGFYPPGIWYHERLYPLVFTANALLRATHEMAVERPAAAPVG